MAIDYITSGHADSVFYGDNAIHVGFGGGKSDKLVFQFTTVQDYSAFQTGKLVFWIKLLDKTNFHFEIEALRDGVEVNNTDESLAVHGLDITNNETWQMITIDLSVPFKKHIPVNLLKQEQNQTNPNYPTKNYSITHLETYLHMAN